MMLSCRSFTDLVASGELDEAGWLTRVQAGQHRLMCKRCRAFEANDRQLDQILRAHRDRLQQPDQDPPDAPPDKAGAG